MAPAYRKSLRIQQLSATVPVTTYTTPWGHDLPEDEWWCAPRSARQR